MSPSSLAISGFLPRNRTGTASRKWATRSCRCGVGGLGRGACGKAPRCQQSYQGRVSGPLLDRIDLTVEVPPVTAADLARPPPAEGTAEVAARVAAARGWTRTLRLARTIADLEGGGPVRRVHVAEALIYRRMGPGGEGVGEAAAVQGH